jgi:CYTH domain-containing protein
MSTEIERKFLVIGEGWRASAGRAASGVRYRQGYLPTGSSVTVRVRVGGERGYLTIKGLHAGLSRAEFEYEIPLADAEQMLAALCVQPLIEKTRYRVPHAGLIWEVDEFDGANAPLVLAEVELESEAQPVNAPDWVGPEVSSDVRYTNFYLSQHPYSTWRPEPDG